MRLFPPLCSAALLCAPAFCQSISAESHFSVEEPLPTYRESILNYEAMSLEGLDPRLSWILEDYYQAAFGGHENWLKIQSLRFEGVLRMPTRTLSFVAFKKKPDYFKIVLFAGNGGRLVMAYDGSDAWQLNTMESREPAPMPPIEALNFIRDAPMAGHLLYPNVPGKRIELLQRQFVDGHACQFLRVTLLSGLQVSYLIDLMDFVERQQVTVNSVSGATEVTTHGRISKIAGVAIPMESKTTVDGELLHKVQIQRVEANLGIMPWMFARPSGAYVPGKLPDGLAELSEDLSMEKSLDLESKRGALAIRVGDDLAPGFFDATRFPDLDEAAKQSILENIGEFWSQE